MAIAFASGAIGDGTAPITPATEAPKSRDDAIILLRSPEAIASLSSLFVRRNL